ncbi:hypothetical protein ABZ093_33730 [Streptomyces cyaneofuscatus]|uniref:hypothetical protein n=1 Tax=Streptomyces cyaneofuscatus TaxID=66883 RepID=UPI0033B63511
MSELIGKQVLDVEVDFYGWCLQDADDTAVPVTFPEGFEGSGFLAEKEGRLDFTSAGHTHTATLTAEVWDGKPLEAETGDAWDEAAEGTITCSSGDLAVWAVAGGPMPIYVHLSDHSGQWSVRARCRGRDEVRLLAREGVPEGVERYLVQFWPAGV